MATAQPLAIRLGRVTTIAVAAVTGLVFGTLPALATEGGTAGGSGATWDGMILAGLAGVLVGIAVTFSLSGSDANHHEEETP